MSTLRHQQTVNSAAWNDHINSANSFIQQNQFKWGVNNYLKTSGTQLNGNLNEVI